MIGGLRLQGFAMIELMAVLLVIAILGTLAIPSFSQRIALDQVTQALTLASFAEQAIATQYASTQAMPLNNAAAGLPPADHIVGNYVSSLTVENGVLTLTLGNQVNRRLTGKLLSIRPAVVPGYPQVPIAWVCAGARVPQQMVVFGVDQTNIPIAELPFACKTVN